MAQPETGTPADAHEDLQLQLSFAEMSLRNGEWDLAREQALAHVERLEPAEDVGVYVELISTLAGCYLERG